MRRGPLRVRVTLLSARHYGQMESLPESAERRLAELDELFGPEQAAYGESYMIRLMEDEELSARVRERFERGKASGKFPVLTNVLSNLSEKEKERFFKTGSMLAGSPRGIVPEDVGVRFRQLQELLGNEPEFITRHPEAYAILFPQRARNMERGGLPLPSFGVHILRHEPRVYKFLPDELIEGDAYSVTYALAHSFRLERGHPPVDQSFWPVEAGFLRGVLLAILSREEYWERIANHTLNPELFEGVEVPQKCAVRLTDLRLAIVLDLEESRRFLLPALRLLERPITAERVVEWKHRLIGNKAEEEANPYWEEFGDRANKLMNSAELTEEALESRMIEIATISFAAAALFLFIDLNVPGIRDEKPYRLDEQIRELAATIKKLLSSLDDRREELQKLLANRPTGRQPRLNSHFYYALCYWRLGHSLEDIAQWLGITPYSSKTGKGTRDWKAKLNRMLAQGKEVENERYPRAAAIFANYRDSSHILPSISLLYTYQFYLVPNRPLTGN